MKSNYSPKLSYSHRVLFCRELGADDKDKCHCGSDCEYSYGSGYSGGYNGSYDGGCNDNCKSGRHGDRCCGCDYGGDYNNGHDSHDSHDGDGSARHLDTAVLYDHYKNSTARLGALAVSSNKALAIFFAMQLGIFILALNAELVFNLLNGVLSKIYNITLERNTALAQTAMWLVALFYVVRYVQLSDELVVQRRYVCELGARLAREVGYALAASSGGQELGGGNVCGDIAKQSRALMPQDRFLDRVLILFHTKVSLILPMLLDQFLTVRELHETSRWSLFTVLDLASSLFIQVVLASYCLSLHPHWLVTWRRTLQRLRAIIKR